MQRGDRALLTVGGGGQRQRSNGGANFGDLYLDAALLALDPRLSPHIRLREEAQVAQVLLDRLAGPQLPVSGAAVRRAGARRRRLPVERGASQFGELSGDGLLSDVVPPGQAWKRQRSSRLDLQNTAGCSSAPAADPEGPENGEYVTRRP